MFSVQEENISKELGLNASEDAKLDDIVEQAEKEIVSGVKNRTFLIGAIAPIVVKLCKASGVLQQVHCSSYIKLKFLSDLQELIRHKMFMPQSSSVFFLNKKLNLEVKIYHRPPDV